MTLSIHWRMTHGLSVSHTSHSITRNTLSFELSLLFSCFYCPFFLKRNVLFESVFFETIGNMVFLSLIWIVLFFRKEYEKTNKFIARRTTFFICVEDCSACGDVVERVKSVYDQLSLISSAGHPLHQAISHFLSFFFFGKKIS